MTGTIQECSGPGHCENEALIEYLTEHRDMLLDECRAAFKYLDDLGPRRPGSVECVHANLGAVIAQVEAEQ